MKKLMFMSAVLMAFCTTTVLGQDLQQSQLPPAIVQNFQESYANAHDVEWEMKGTQYQVEFEAGMFGPDHEIWYDQEGNILRHEQDISENDLPQAVRSVLKNEFDGYRVSSVEKITEENNTMYTMELESLTEEWNVAFDENGKVLQEVMDD